ncbi:MAG: SCO family protein [Thermoanaerobaculia bacterium]|nr:SCO family protein [Thermoanaerobaculia bacterium]
MTRRIRPSRRLLAAALLSVLVAVSSTTPSFADQSLVEPEKMPGPLKEVSFEQKLGDILPLDASFRDHTGKEVRLGDYWGEKPVLLAFVYYECPMLCSLILNGMASSLSVLEFRPSEEFDVVAISIDHEETPAMAAKARADTLRRYGRDGTDSGWHFLLGDEATVRRVADAAGYGFEYIPSTDEFAHSSGIVVTTPEGQIAQYYYGIEYPPKDLRLALIEASKNKIGSLVDQVLLYCYKYDPKIGQYTALTMRLLRITGGLFALGLIAFLWFSFRHDRAAQSPAASESPKAGSLGAV